MEFKNRLSTQVGKGHYIENEPLAVSLKSEAATLVRLASYHEVNTDSLASLLM